MPWHNREAEHVRYRRSLRCGHLLTQLVHIGGQHRNGRDHPAKWPQLCAGPGRRIPAHNETGNLPCANIHQDACSHPGRFVQLFRNEVIEHTVHVRLRHLQMHVCHGLWHISNDFAGGRSGVQKRTLLAELRQLP